MRLDLSAPPFTRAALADAFGFAVPQPFVDALNVFCQDCATAEDAYRRVEERLGWLLAGEDQRYSATPPEMHPVAGTGMDGGHFGYVIHAPELGETDYPLARYEPMDSDPVRRVGRTTAEALSNVLSDELHPSWQAEADWPAALPADVSNQLAALSIVPTRGRSFSSATEYGHSSGVAPDNIPIGWRHVPSSDGIGVLAPESAFDASCEHHVVVRPVISVLIAAAEAALAAGYPATALWQAREGLWRECHQPTDENLALSKVAITAYRAFGRPHLARIAERRLLKDFKGRSSAIVVPGSALARMLHGPAWFTIQELEAALLAAGMGRWSRPLAERYCPTMIMERGPVADGASSPIGASRLGGMPDMPRDMPWPVRPPLADPQGGVWADHASRSWPLSFIAQIDFAEIAAAGGLDGFPETGRLLFFADPIDYPWGQEAEDQTRAHVVFTADPVEHLERRGFPAEFSSPGFNVDTRYLVFRACRLMPRRWLLPPPFASLALLSIAGPLSPGWTGIYPQAWSEAEQNAYSAFWDDLADRYPDSFGKPRWQKVHQVGGLAWSIQDPVEVDCVKYADADHNNLPHYRAWMNKPPSSRHPIGSAEHESACAAFSVEQMKQMTAYVDRAVEWQVVLQIDSDDGVALGEGGAGMQWGDLGRLYVAIRKADLAARRFDRTWTMMQCS